MVENLKKVLNEKGKSGELEMDDVVLFELKIRAKVGFSFGTPPFQGGGCTHYRREGPRGIQIRLKNRYIYWNLMKRDRFRNEKLGRLKRRRCDAFGGKMKK